ncbi:MAG: hypothetical protein EOO46_20430 [Flavobacterium sp.]|nr:MAG: hypothetical protein EOO46_20430 [Flavobacterium sp.]
MDVKGKWKLSRVAYYSDEKQDSVICNTNDRVAYEKALYFKNSKSAIDSAFLEVQKNFLFINDDSSYNLRDNFIVIPTGIHGYHLKGGRKGSWKQSGDILTLVTAPTPTVPWEYMFLIKFVDNNTLWLQRINENSEPQANLKFTRL